MSYLSKILFLSLTLIVLCLLSQDLSAQSNTFNQRDDTYRLLGLKRARQAYEAARVEFERQGELHERKLITELAFEQARNQFTDAEVNYQQSLLAVLFEQQYVTITGAVKYQAKDGSRHVRLTLENASGGTAEFEKLIDMEDELFRSLQPDVINNVYVSILNDEEAIISQPYEAKIWQLHFGHPEEIDFVLLQDLDAVNISIIFANGSQRTMKIRLQKEATANQVLVQSEQFSQEVELGKTTSFDLTLELFSGTSNTFSLDVVNLPRQISRFFKDNSGSVRLSQVKFTESTRAKAASLEITLPDRPSETVLMDQPIPFFVLVLPRERADSISQLGERQWTEEELTKLDISFVKLELVPRGIGELIVRLPQLYHTIEKDSSAAVTMDIGNEGSHRIDNVEVRVDLPLNWIKSLSPERLKAIDIGEEKSIALSFTPPEDIAPGKYEIRLRISAMSNGLPITAEDKMVTVEIRTDTNLFGTLLIALLLLGFVGGIVFYGVRLSRR